MPPRIWVGVKLKNHIEFSLDLPTLLNMECNNCNTIAHGGFVNCYYFFNPMKKILLSLDSCILALCSMDGMGFLNPGKR